MIRFSEKVVFLCTPAQKAALQRIAGGKQKVSHFMRFLMLNVAQLHDDKGAAEAFAEEFAEGIHKSIEKMIDEKVKAMMSGKKQVNKAK